MAASGSAASTASAAAAADLLPDVEASDRERRREQRLVEAARRGEESAVEALYRTHFDVIYRYLLHLGYEVTYIRNFTDIDDKIIRRANEEGADYRIIADRYIQAFYEDMDRLGLLRPTLEPLSLIHI